ncbi:MAG: helix-turn-helix transcriptional regulator [Verrucomicrobiota bacterium]
MSSTPAEAFLQALVDTMKKERARLEISQDRLATKSGVDRGTISRFERLERIPSILALYDLAEALGTPLHKFVEIAHKQASSPKGD